MKKTALLILACLLASACDTPAERMARRLADRLVPQYQISFRETKDTIENYRVQTKGNKLVIEGSSASAMAVGLNRYLNDFCHTTVSWYAADPVEVPERMPVVSRPVTGRALVKDRFFLNYCTFGYTMPWWEWTDWERMIDWMALQGVNLPLACTGQEAVWQEVWREFGLTDEEIRNYFTGPAYLPWHRMINIDGVDGPLPQEWIDGQEKLQKQILQRERELGMRPALPAFAGHVPARLQEIYPIARITDVKAWGGFPQENACHFLSPEDSLFKQIQHAFLKAQECHFGTDHIYGFDLFNEVPPPSWEPESLASIGWGAYESVADTDPEARWIQMGWLFYNDRKNWTPERIKAYLEAIPSGKVTLLDYYTENIPVWKETEGFYSQPYIFCYLGNFGGNTRLAGPFRKESERITEALVKGGASGIGCTLEGFGINQWFYEYIMGRAWETGITDDAWLASLDARHNAPEGFWKEMADSIYLRGSFSEGPLLCGRPCEEGFHHWTVVNHTPYDNATLERLWKRLQAYPDASSADLVILETQVLGNRFESLRNDFVASFRAGQAEETNAIGEQMKQLLLQIDSLASTRPEFRAEDWLEAASAWGKTPEEKQYYRDNAWHLLTIWGEAPNLNDYANRVWSGLVRAYYLPRWELFIQTHLDALEKGIPYDVQAFDKTCRELELRLAEHAPEFL
jgi:alpha-N-acetylglucosaminidase